MGKRTFTNKTKSKNENPSKRMFNPGAMANLEKISDIQDNLNYSSHIKYSSPFFNHKLAEYSDVPYLEDAEVEYG